MSDIIKFPKDRVVAGPRPAPRGNAGAAPTISRAAFLAWLPTSLRPAAIAVELLDLAERHGRPAACPVWAAQQAELAAVIRLCWIRGRRVLEFEQAWHRAVRAACAAEKARRADRAASFQAFVQSDDFWSGAS